ncbi:MAG TPA: hypothetical protein VMW16_06570 [Sedimentisphaerales bacterium]|nr:hypothetical protein [Sedimentisphaerales bacterium]
MSKLEKYKFTALIMFAGLFLIAGTNAKANENNILDIIIAGVKLNDSLINNISFSYTVDYNVSEEWRKEQLEFTKTMMGNEYSEEIELRVSTLEHTLRTGSTVCEGSKFNIASKIVALSDQEVFQDEVVTCDGIQLTELNIKEGIGYISNEPETRRSDLMFDVRNFPTLFVDGQSMYSALTSDDTAVSVLGTETIDGAACYVIEMVKSFSSPSGIQMQVKRRCWIAPEKGYLVKKAISYSVETPDKPLNITESELAESADGIWYYSKATFHSYPLFLTKPDVVAVLELKNIAINQQLRDDTFIPDTSKVTKIYDTVLRFSYPTEPLSLLDAGIIE